MASYGRFQVAEPPHTLLSLHIHDGGPLKEVDWEPKNAVLDQEDLFAQNIFVGDFIPGARNVNALGSCVFNANTSALSLVMPQETYLGVTRAHSYGDTTGLEKFAITTYHDVTDLTGSTSTEWPPTDCGSSGPHIFTYAYDRGWIAGQKVAHGAQNIVSLLQEGAVLQGTPWFMGAEQPDAAGFIDGNGSVSAIERLIRSGVVGGHETVITAIEKLVLHPTGVVDVFNTVLRIRNSWSAAWGDHGSCRCHLSLLVAIGGYSDFRRWLPITS